MLGGDVFASSCSGGDEYLENAAPSPLQWPSQPAASGFEMLEDVRAYVRFHFTSELRGMIRCSSLVELFRRASLLFAPCERKVFEIYPNGSMCQAYQTQRNISYVYHRLSCLCVVQSTVVFQETGKELEGSCCFVHRRGSA